MKFVRQDKYGKLMGITVVNFIDICQIKHKIWLSRKEGRIYFQ